jgi:hypothetical protein
LGTFVTVAVVTVLVLVFVGLMLQRFGAEGARRQEAVLTEARETLSYRVPEGQDPAAVLVALSRCGFEAVSAPGDSHLLVIECPMGVSQQREEVRTLLENEAPLNLEEDPNTVQRATFTDE